MKRSALRIADLFCGAGGTTTGAVEAAKRLGYKAHVTAVNHWNVAIATHSANHPDAQHFCAPVDSVNPRKLYREGELDILLASPECMGHSIALGDKPINDQSRATAWCVLRWIDATRPGAVLIENVPEFTKWAPLGSNNRPLKSREGEVFDAFIAAIRALGYKVEWRELCCADYGDPTTRSRLFIQAVRGRRRIVWPNPTHVENDAQMTFGEQLRRWVAARKIIDWSIKGTRVSQRKRPLSVNTMQRIIAGWHKFGCRPFLNCMEHGGRLHDVDRPMPTITTAKGGAIAVAEPYLIQLRGTDGAQVASTASSIDSPVRTVSGGNNHYLVEPYLVQAAHGNGSDANGDSRRVKSINEPMPTVCGNRGDWYLCEPFIVPNFGERDGQRPRTHSINDPLPAVTGHGAGALVEPMLVPQGGGGALRPVSEPAPTVATDGAIALVQPYIVSYYGTGNAASIDKPLETVTAKDRFGLVLPIIEAQGKRFVVDFLYRMLQPHELAAAQGFPRSYKFTGTKTQVVKQIGNAVPRRTARALVAAILQQHPDVSQFADDEGTVAA